MPRPSVKDAIQAIKESNGFVSHAAAKCGTSRATLHTMINQHASLKEAVDDAREAMKDFAENKLFQNIKDGKETSLIFYLKTQGKSRGYIERSEQVTFDLSKATDEQLQRISDGEHPATVMANAGGGAA